MRGFFISFLVNLAFRFEWAVLGLILLVLHFLLGIPVWLAVIAFGAWFLHAFGVTLFLASVRRLGTEDEAISYRENKNPYSARTSDLIRKAKEPKAGGEDRKQDNR